MGLFFGVELIELTVHRLSNSGYFEPIVQLQHQIARCGSHLDGALGGPVGF